MIHIVVRAEQSFFFTAEGYEDDGPSRLWFLRAEQPSQFQHSRYTGSIVVGAVVNLAFTRRQTSFTASTKVIIMCAEHDHFILEIGISTIQNADDVEGGNSLP